MNAHKQKCLNIALNVGGYTRIETHARPSQKILDLVKIPKSDDLRPTKYTAGEGGVLVSVYCSWKRRVI